MVNRGVWDQVFEVLCVRGHKDTVLVRLGGPRDDERPHPHPRMGGGWGFVMLTAGQCACSVDVSEQARVR